MATSSVKSPVTRVTSAYVRDRGLRPLYVTITGSVLELRPFNTRRTETVDLATVWQRAVKERVAAARAAKKAKRVKR